MRHIYIKTKPFYDNSLKAMAVDIIDATSHHSDVIETKKIGERKGGKNGKKR